MSMSKELLAFCDSTELSEEGLREIMEGHNVPIIFNGVGFFFAACRNERVTEGIIRYLLKCFPDAASATNWNGMKPLHYACLNSNVTINIIQLLIDANPDSIRNVCNSGRTPLHILCRNRRGVDEAAAIQILTLLIKAYPGSEQIASTNGTLPLHNACSRGSLAMVEYLYKLYPDAIIHATPEGFYRGHYPIHYAIMGIQDRDDPSTAVEIFQFLLDCDPNQKLIQLQGTSLLHFACGKRYNSSNIEAGIQLIKVLFDAHPEAIGNNGITSRIHRFHQQVQAFINNELVYARQAQDHSLMITPDYNGQLPLHTALQRNVRLGSIKLLINGNPSAIRNFDNNGAIPLHVACEHHDSDVVQYLVSLADITLDTIDREGSTALHYACRGAKYDTIALLLEKYDAVSVSKRNDHGKLPIDLLWESNAVEDRESPEHVETVFQLLRAYPEMVTMSNLTLN